MYPPRWQRRSVGERQAALRGDAPRRPALRYIDSLISGDRRIVAVGCGCRRQVAGAYRRRTGDQRRETIPHGWTAPRSAGSGLFGAPGPGGGHLGGLAGRGLARWQGYGEWDGFSPATGLDSELIYEVLPLGDGSLWVGTENGLFRGRKIGERWLWRRHAGVGRIPVHALRMDRDGDLWLGTEGYGVGRIDARTGRIEWFNKTHGLAAEYAS